MPSVSAIYSSNIRFCRNRLDSLAVLAFSDLHAEVDGKAILNGLTIFVIEGEVSAIMKAAANHH